MLSRKQGEILDVIIRYIEEEGISPTVREICELANLSSTSTVYGYLKRLEKHGYIERRVDTPRSIRVIKGLNKERGVEGMIKNLGKNAKMSQAELGKSMGDSDSGLSYYGAKERIHSKPEAAVSLEDAFNVYVDELLGDSNENNEEEDYGDIRHKEIIKAIKTLAKLFDEEGITKEDKKQVLGYVLGRYIKSEEKRK